MRLVRRVLAGAATSLALGALFTTAALAAEPTTVEGDADATVTIGLGSDEGLGTDVDLDGILGVEDDTATDAVVDLDGDATLNIASRPPPVGRPALTSSSMPQRRRTPGRRQVPMRRPTSISAPPSHPWPVSGTMPGRSS